MTYNTSQRNLLEFIRAHQVVAEAAKTLLIPSLVRHIVGTDFSGTWWSLQDSSAIFNALQKLRSRKDILVCKLAKGKVTLVHQNSFLPLVSLSSKFLPGALDKVEERHMDNGRHELTKVPVEVWWAASPSATSPLLSEPAALKCLNELTPGLSGVIRKFYA
ncbi:hypothetical protein [Accumulibacter sp.]|uniref:hypothetical protein n=1 Tax=Accumulibacter sp. TaxID=2053492 RepID=UPI0028C46BDD|nr:hypothetical protein [Accumulibacter sp.]